MEFEALSPDNSMALFYAYLLLTETKISEGGINAGKRFNNTHAVKVLYDQLFCRQ